MPPHPQFLYGVTPTQKQMGKHSTDAQKIQFLTELKYNSCCKAGQIVGLAPSTAKDIKARVGYLLALHHENGWDPPTIEQQIARKEGSGAKSSLTENDLNVIFEACTIDKKSRATQQHQIADTLGFNQYCTTIETQLRKRGLYRVKSTKKLGLTDVQRAQRYEIALSRKNWGFAEWSKVIFSDEASILIGEKRGQQKISAMVNE
jgi:hypothetical protein